jgi:hypothetical protein
VTTSSVKVRVRNAAVADVLAFRPPVGRWWPRSGGIHIGVLDGKRLVMGPFAPTEPTWSEAQSWAHEVRIGPHHDFALPTVVELALMVRVLPSLFGVSRFWSRDQVADVLADAWAYDLLIDGPVGWGKHFNSFAVAIRREPLNWSKHK